MTKQISGKAYPSVVATGLLVRLSILAVFIWLAQAILTGGPHFSYLIWNLGLAWLPLVFAWLLTRRLTQKGEIDFWPKFYFGLWLIFLPNAFYLITDLVHLLEIGEQNLMFNIVLFSFFIMIGMAIGILSILMVEKQLRLFLRPARSNLVVGVVITLVGFALYLGREMRWNSWDIVADPFGLVFTVSDVVIHPSAHPQAFAMTVIFSSFFGIIYASVRYLVRLVRP